MKTFAQNAVGFYSSLDFKKTLASGVEIINPYENEEVISVVKRFFEKYYNDRNKRTFIFGINPGRYGAGTTGIGFTDPVALRIFCSIENELGTKRELSSRFIYDMIDKFGGADKFYKSYFLTAMFPLALIKNGKNYNYYDDKITVHDLFPHIKNLILKQIEFGADKQKVICIGKKNFEFLKAVNEEINFFKKIVIVNHPRWIMQYRLKRKDFYIEEYLKALQQ
jgi:hypothetical protein